MKANEVGVVIKKLLLNNSAVSALVGKKIFPVVAPMSTDNPFVIYRRNSVAPAYTKDRNSYGDTATVDVIMACNEYGQSIELLNAVFDALQGGGCRIIDGIHIDDIRMINSEEDFQEDCYLQSLTFEIDVIND